MVPHGSIVIVLIVVVIVVVVVIVPVIRSLTVVTDSKTNPHVLHINILVIESILRFFCTSVVGI